MGRHFGIQNDTKGHKVSGSWTACEFCDCHLLMHRYKWHPSDKIFSASYCDYCEFSYVEGQYSMICKNIDMHAKMCEEAMNEEDTENEGEKKEKKKDVIKLGFHFPHADEPCIFYADPSINVDTHGACDICKAIDKMDHVPQWQGDVCTICSYKFDPNHIEEDKKNFSPVFHMN